MLILAPPGIRDQGNASRLAPLYSSIGCGALRAPVLLSLSVAMLIGVCAQRSRFCVMAALRNVLLMRHLALVKGLAAMLVSTFLVNLLVGQFALGFEGQPIAHTSALQFRRLVAHRGRLDPRGGVSQQTARAVGGGRRRRRRLCPRHARRCSSGAELWGCELVRRLGSARSPGSHPWPRRVYRDWLGDASVEPRLTAIPASWLRARHRDQPECARLCCWSQQGSERLGVHLPSMGPDML